MHLRAFAFLHAVTCISVLSVTGIYLYHRVLGFFTGIYIVLAWNCEFRFILYGIIYI